MTEEAEPIPDVRNDPVPEPVRTGDDDGSTVDHHEGD